MEQEKKTSKKTSIAQIDRGSFKRILSVADLFAVGYGDLGSSIYYALGITAFFALGATPIALLLAGLVFACTALTYAEMSSVVHESGGSASYSRRAFNDLISFIAGWALLLDYIVTISISSYAVAPYLSFFLAFLKITWVKIAFTVFLISLLCILNIVGTKCSTRLSVVLTSLTVVTQLIIIVVGAIALVNLPQFFSHLKIGGGTLWSPTWKDFIKGVAMAMVAYTGIESMAQLSSEAKNPSKTVPRAIVLAMGTLILMYLGISTVALSALNPQQLSTTYIEDPIAGIVSKLPFASEFLGPWVGLLAAIILMVAANAGLIGASRLSFNMSEYCQLPRFFYRLHFKFKTPYVALIVFAGFSSAIVIWSGGSLSFLADLYNFGAMLAFFSAHLALIMHRIRYPKIKRPFKIPFGIKIKGAEVPITAILGCLVTFSVWILVIVTKPDGRILGVAWLIFGLSMYAIYRRQQQINITGSVEIQKIKIEEFKDLKINRILVPTKGAAQTETVQIACHVAKHFNAELTAVHIVHVPFSFSLNMSLVAEEEEGKNALKRAEAIAREIGVKVKLEMIKSRSVEKAIIEKANKDGFDLVILGVHSTHHHGVSHITEHILRDITCKVLVFKS